MTQSELNRAVAAATGESICTVSHLGFTIADPDAVDYDPEPCDVEGLIVDWDALDARRTSSLAPALA
jgi:hypothetical protein